MKLARAFKFTRELEAEIDRLFRLQANVDDLHHAEIEAQRQEIDELNGRLSHQRDLRAAAEAISGLKDEELERQRHWIDKLSDQNLALMDRICLQNRSVPVSEPLTKAPLTDPDDPTDKARTLRRLLKTGPYASAKAAAQAEYDAEKGKEDETAARAVAAVHARAAATSSDPPQATAD